MPQYLITIKGDATDRLGVTAADHDPRGPASRPVGRRWWGIDQHHNKMSPVRLNDIQVSRQVDAKVSRQVDAKVSRQVGTKVPR
jgi:hypothetical protein